MNKIINFLKSIFFTGVRTEVWYNVHYEFESAESGKWVEFGDPYFWKFTSTWFYLLGVPIWRLKYTAENKGIYNMNKALYNDKEIL